MNKVRPKILVVDGNNLAHMGHGRQVMTHEGERTEVAYLGISMLVNNLNQFNPDRVAVVWDGGKDERRMKLAPEYKGQRRKDLTPAEKQEWDLFFKQMNNLQDVFSKLGVPQFKCSGREADDVIYSLMKMIDDATKGVVDFVVMSTDKDFLQLIDDFDRGPNGPGVIVWNPVKKEEWYGSKFESEYGFDVEWYLDWKALVGDPSDNLKGIKGIGKKGATLLVQEVISKESTEYVITDKKLIKYACMFGDNFDEFRRMRKIMKFYVIDEEEVVAGKIPTDVETPAVLQENMVGILNKYGFERFLGRLGEILSPFEQLLFRRKE